MAKNFILPLTAEAYIDVFEFKHVPRIVYTNMRSCSSIIILIGLANVFAFILTNERIPQKVATAILSMTTNRILVILLINLVLIFVGMFMESLAAILITFPVLLPVATAVGMNPVHFALMAILNLMIGLNGYTLCSGIICEELNGDDSLAIPLKESEKMQIGYIHRAGSVVSALGEIYIEELMKYQSAYAGKN